MLAYPPKHRRFIELGIFKRLDDPNDWMKLYDVKFPASELSWDDYLPSDRIVEVLPFAINGAGDVWGYRCDKLPDAPITCFCHDDTLADEVAADIERFFVTQLILNAISGASKDHPDVPLGWTRNHVLRMCAELSELLSPEPGRVLEQLRCAVFEAPIDYSTPPLDEEFGRRMLEELRPNGYQWETFDWRQF